MAYIEEETIGSVTSISNSLPWHLDRIDQYKFPDDNAYRAQGTGEGVDIYILDTGIFYNHREFEGRAEYGGYDPVDARENENRKGLDCNGHGTHVASLAVGKTFGAAKMARVYSIRVIGCNGRVTDGTLIDGLNYIARVIPTRGRPAIVSMSLVTSYSLTLDRALTTVHDQGIIMVTSAGDKSEDACRYLPAGSSQVITVGASNFEDRLYRLTNGGSCVDIFAPGVNILGAKFRCSRTSCTEFKSGTSMATPLVSGVAAILLKKMSPSSAPDQLKTTSPSVGTPDAQQTAQKITTSLSPSEMKTKLLSTAIPDVLDFSSTTLTPSLISATPNRLLYIGGKPIILLPQLYL